MIMIKLYVFLKNVCFEYNLKSFSNFIFNLFLIFNDILF